MGLCLFLFFNINEFWSKRAMNVMDKECCCDMYLIYLEGRNNFRDSGLSQTISFMYQYSNTGTSTYSSFSARVNLQAFLLFLVFSTKH